MGLKTVVFGVVGSLALVAAAPAEVWARDYNKVRSRTWVLDRTKQVQGQEPDDESAKKVKAHGCDGDDRGHIRANSMGGGGGPDNIFPQNPTVNRGAYALWEQTIVDLLNRQEKQQYIFDTIRVRVDFTFDSKAVKPNRPTKVKYCYSGRRLDPGTGKRSQVKQCKEFNNPAPPNCSKDPKFEQLIRDVNKHIKEAEKTLTSAKKMEDSFLGRACRRDYERLGDKEWAAAVADYKKTVENKVKKRFKNLDNEHNRLEQELASWKQKPAAIRDRADKKQKAMQAHYKTMLSARKGEFTASGSLRFKVMRDFNIKQQKALQKKLKCHYSPTGDKVEDCRVDKPSDRAKSEHCKVWEIAPSDHPKKGRIRARAQRFASEYKKNPSKGHYKCKGTYAGGIKLYRSCDFFKPGGKKLKLKLKPAKKRPRLKLKLKK